MIKRSILYYGFGLLFSIICAYLFICIKDAGYLNFFYTLSNNETKNYKDIYSALVSFYGGNLGFVIASVTIVFGVIERPTFDKLFRNDTVTQLYVYFFLIIISSAINAVISFFGMLFNETSENYLTFVIAMMFYWLINFLYFIFIFFALIKSTVAERKKYLKESSTSRVNEMKAMAKNLEDQDS